MTKEEIRCISLSKLNLCESDLLLDIGAGTGSVSIEAATLVKQVFSLECHQEAIELIRKNVSKFKIGNMTLIEKKAPEGLPKIAINKVFIGGTRGQMEEILRQLETYPIQVVVVNTITVENTYLALKTMESLGYKTEMLSVNVSRSHSVGHVTMMKAHNPINIITGVKE